MIRYNIVMCILYTCTCTVLPGLANPDLDMDSKKEECVFAVACTIVLLVVVLKSTIHILHNVLPGFCIMYFLVFQPGFRCGQDEIAQACCHLHIFMMGVCFVI